jgi:hypothetical protein
MKLSKAQTELLFYAKAGTYCVTSYKPAERLVSLGLAEWRDGDKLYATEAGRTALSSVREP